jgi:penicillin amidase
VIGSWLPRRRHEIELSSLGARVEVRIDSSGVPHVRAETEADLFRVQGFLTARERFFQMDFTRWATRGRLAEHLGDREIDAEAFSVFLEGRTLSDADWLMRAFDLVGAAERSLSALSADGRSLLDAYAQGVNAWIRARRAPHTLEHGVLGIRSPELWTPLDSLLVAKGLAFDQSGSWRTILVIEALSLAFEDQPEKLAQLLPRYPLPPPSTAKTRAASEKELLELLSLEESYRAFIGYGGAHIGSNNWVLSPKKSETGRAVLANDPHLGMTAPSPFTLIHLESPQYHVTGATIAGLPGVVLGHNERIAWGVTTACVQDADCFVEELDGRGNYRRPDGSYAPLTVREEQIRIRGQKEPLVRTVRRTEHGPLISDVVRAGIGDAGRALSYRWTGDAVSHEMDALLAVSRAKNYDDWRAGLRSMAAPALNWVYADVEGNIGYQLAGHVPVRADRGSGARPVPGWDPKHAWERVLTLDELPHLYNPPAEAIATANNQVVDDDYPFPISVAFEPYHRHQRIWQVLKAKQKHSLDDARRLQLDERSTWAEELIRGLIAPELEKLDPADRTAAKAKEILLGWDFVAGPQSAAATIFYRMVLALGGAVLRPALGDKVFRSYFELVNFSVLPLESILLDPRSPWLSGLDRRGLVATALNEAVRDLSDKLGPEPASWRWGALHQTTMSHVLGGVPVLGRLLNIGPYPKGGDGMTVSNGQFNYAYPYGHSIGAGLRAVYDVGDWDASTVVLSTGVSGRPRSKHYRDHAARWARGEQFPLPFSRAAVERATVRRLSFVPKK